MSIDPTKRKLTNYLQNPPSQSKKSRTEGQDRLTRQACEMFNNQNSSFKAASIKQKNIHAFCGNEDLGEYEIDIEKIKEASYPLFIALLQNVHLDSDQPSDVYRVSEKGQIILQMATYLEVFYPEKDSTIEIDPVSNLPEKKPILDKEKVQSMLPQILAFLEKGTEANPINNENVVEFFQLSGHLSFKELENLALKHMEIHPIPLEKIKFEEFQPFQIKKLFNIIMDSFLSGRYTNQKDYENLLNFIKENKKYYTWPFEVFIDTKIYINDKKKRKFISGKIQENLLTVLSTIQNINTIEFKKNNTYAEIKAQDLARVLLALRTLNPKFLKNLFFTASIKKYGRSGIFTLNSHYDLKLLIGFLNDKKYMLDNLRVDFTDFKEHSFIPFDEDDNEYDYLALTISNIKKLSEHTRHFSLGFPLFLAVKYNLLDELVKLQIPVITDTVDDNVISETPSSSWKEFKEVGDYYIACYTVICHKFSAYPLESLELYLDFIDSSVLTANTKKWDGNLHFGTEDTELNSIQNLFDALSKLEVKRLVLRYPHCRVNGYMKKALETGLKGLKELHIIGCLDIKGNVEELEKILSAQKGLKYTITCGDILSNEYPSRVIVGTTSE